MLHKTRGIVFKTTNFSESSVVAQIFTEKFGMQSYLVRGVKKPKPKISYNMLQPLHLLEMVVYHKSTSHLQNIAELKSSPVLQDIPYNVVKSSIVFFLNEVLFKSIRQQASDDALFNYIFHAIELLDRIEEGLANFHLFFLIRLSQFLGFYPHPADSETAPFFDLQSGLYARNAPLHAFYLQHPLTEKWTLLLNSSFESLQFLHISLPERRLLLQKILEYYKLHIDDFGEIKSHGILEGVLV